MNYHNITHDDMLNGEGLRVVLWVAGCDHHCKNCQNPETWNQYGGIEFDEKALEEIITEYQKPYISGITFSGGDPLQTNNVHEVGRLCQFLKGMDPTKTIWIYTGYLWEQIKRIDFLRYVDVLVDGEFKEELKDENYPWAGSTNQRIIDVQTSLKAGRASNTVYLWKTK